MPWMGKSFNEVWQWGKGWKRMTTTWEVREQVQGSEGERWEKDDWKGEELKYTLFIFKCHVL